jgi:arginase
LFENAPAHKSYPINHEQRRWFTFMSAPKTLRLIMPQWQGGTIPTYYLGSQLLAWLCPAASGPVATVPVDEPTDAALPLEDGIVARTALLRQADSAAEILRDHSPDRVVVLGGDCLVSLSPFAYLNERYDADLAVLWVDAHPDISTPATFTHAHAMVLGSLLGSGDADFASRVKRPVRAANVMYAGAYAMMPYEQAFVAEHGLRVAGPGELAASSEPVLAWLREIGVRNVAVHLDLDVLDPAGFRSLYFSDPAAAPGAFDGITQGRMTMPQVVRLLADVAKAARVVGLTVAEHLPWDAVALRKMLGALPILGDAQ